MSYRSRNFTEFIATSEIYFEGIPISRIIHNRCEPDNWIKKSATQSVCTSSAPVCATFRFVCAWKNLRDVGRSYRLILNFLPAYSLVTGDTNETGNGINRHETDTKELHCHSSTNCLSDIKHKIRVCLVLETLKASDYAVVLFYITTEIPRNRTDVHYYYIVWSSEMQTKREMI